jgi:transcriptional regulator with XRE-family HTH domain
MAMTTRTERRILGGAVYRIRRLMEIKQDTLAQGVGIHPAYLSNIERSKKQPSVETMAAIANFLGVDLTDITYLASVVVIDGAENAA